MLHQYCLILIVLALYFAEPISSQNWVLNEGCRDYAKHVFVVESKEDGTTERRDECFKSNKNVEDGIVEAGEFPFMARLGNGLVDAVKWICSGTLISDTFIMSAAHCTYSIDTTVEWALLGEHIFDKEIIDGVNATFMKKIVQKYQMPQYKTSSRYDDVSLFKLKEAVTFTKYIRPVCLHSDSGIPRDTVIAVGWSGENKEMRKIQMNIISSEECQTRLTPMKRLALPQGVTNMTLCAVPADHNDLTHICKVDSGGPLLVKLQDPYCMYLQIGVMSFNPRCNDKEDNVSVFSRVSFPVSPWINIILTSNKNLVLGKPRG